MNHTEYQEQCAFFEWLSIKYPQAFAVSTASAAGEIRCSIQKGVRLKKMGVRKGWPDIFIAYPTASYHGCFIEMKSKTGRVTEEQKKIGKLLFMSGYYWVYANGWEEAAEIWENYLNG